MSINTDIHESVHVADDIHEQLHHLLMIADCEKLLSKIILKLIDHQLTNMILNLHEYDLNILHLPLLKLTLQESAALLIPRHREYPPAQILQRRQARPLLRPPRPPIVPLHPH